jgi:hypothetical protein
MTHQKHHEYIRSFDGNQAKQSSSRHQAKIVFPFLSFCSLSDVLASFVPFALEWFFGHSGIVGFHQLEVFQAFFCLSTVKMRTVSTVLKSR